MNRFRLIMILAIAACAVASIPMASACGTTKLDVAVYNTINQQGNPIQAMPGDTTVFSFHVTWVVTRTTSGGQLVSKTSSEVGVFTASQQHPGGFNEIFGAPYEKSVSICTWHAGPLCVWWDSGKEVGSYLIVPYVVPPGYCPQYPSQDRAKDTNPSSSGKTGTVNEKFYMGAYCAGIYPGFTGSYGSGQCYPNKCYILIQ
jgi:hypothetical protein